jgi:Glycosyl hydrolase catalytic core
MPTLIASVVVAIIALLASVPSASAAAPRGFVGLSSEEVFGNPGPLRDKSLPQQRKAGVRLLRQTFDWSLIEGSSGVYDFSIYDRFVLDLARNGITVLPILFNPPEFRSSRPARNAKDSTYPPRSAAEMGEWAARLVDRYGPNGSLWSANPGVRPQPIRAWQIWNEPNLKVYWGGRPNARQYVSLLRTVGAAIKARDRGAEIVTAAVAPSSLSGTINIFKYIDQMYRAGGARAFDTLAINSYAVSAAGLKKLMDRVRKTMNRRGDRRAKIWITELGWCDKGVKHRFCVGQQKQARNITQSLKLIAKSRGRWRLRGFVYFSWRDGRPYAPEFKNMWGLHTGLLTLSGRRKPAYSAFTGGVKRFR